MDKNQYLNFLTETIKKNRFAFSFWEDGLNMLFEITNGVTGSDNTNIFVEGATSIKNLEIGKDFNCGFQQTWSLNYDEALKAYLNDGKKGSYSGHGNLLDNKRCDFTFSSNILPGIYKIYDGGWGNSIVLKRLK